MTKPSMIDKLWDAARASGRVFDPAQTSTLPETARRYLVHAIAPGTQLASAVRLQMHGEIKLRNWCRFSAEEVIHWDRGMVWKATVRIYGITIRGHDSIVDGHGSMRWKLFGVIPFINARGPDVSRSAAGRVNIESVWLPSVLVGDSVSWTVASASSLRANFRAHGETAEIDYLIDELGRVKSISMSRWGNPDGGEFRYVRCGAFADQERTFNGYTIPTRMRVGWYFGTERFDSEGEFFRVTIDAAEYR